MSASAFNVVKKEPDIHLGKMNNTLKPDNIVVKK